MPKFRFRGYLGSLLPLVLMMGFGVSAAQAAPPPVIALLTDYGWEDPYVAELKGVIVTLAPNARILDLTHTVAPFNVAEGAYLLDQSAAEFPAGTIFVAVVDPQVGTERDPVLIETKQGKFFVGPDNGLFTHVIDNEGLDKAWKLDQTAYFRAGTTSFTFHGRDIFAPVAAHLANGTPPEQLGTPIQTLMMLPVKEATFNSDTLSVEVLHLDRYGNVILNLRRDSEIAAKLKEGTLVKVSVGKQNFSGPLVKTYGDLEKGRLILLYGGDGFLEIAINQGSAAKELKVQAGTVIFLKP